jgi:predicted ArsR family transcriptional regulator
MTARLDEAIDGIAVLGDPVRRELYRHVAAQREPVGRDAAAAAVGISRPLAAFHLDRLVSAGLLQASYRRLSGRSGPGAGRPSKLYERANRELAVSLPERRYDVAAGLFADALAAGTEGTTPADALDAAARSLGMRLGADARRRAGPRPSRRSLLTAASVVLADAGFEPAIEGTDLVLRNCPFDAIARTHRDLMCGTNLSLMRGVIEGLRTAGLTVELDPQPGMCCVVWHPA